MHCFCDDDQKAPGGSNSRALGTHSSCFWWRVLTENSQEMISVQWYRRFTSNIIIDKTQNTTVWIVVSFQVLYHFYVFCDFLCFRKPASSKKPSTKGASSKRTSGKDSESSKKSRESEKSRKSEKGSSLRFVQKNLWYWVIKTCYLKPYCFLCIKYTQSGLCQPAVKG